MALTALDRRCIRIVIIYKAVPYHTTYILPSFFSFFFGFSRERRRIKGLVVVFCSIGSLVGTILLGCVVIPFWGIAENCTLPLGWWVCILLSTTFGCDSTL